MGSVYILRNACKLQAYKNISQNILCPTVNLMNHTKFSRTFTQLTPSGTDAALMKSQLVSQRFMSGGDHSKLWPIEKAVTVAMVGIIPATFLFPNPILDSVFAVSIVMHMHWGLEACCQDYVRPIIFGPVIPKLTIGLLYLISAGTLGSLLYYNYNDIGIGATFRKFWQIKE